MDELLALINQDFPDFYQQLIRFPSTFRYSKEMLHETEGFPGVATQLFQHQRVSRNPRDVDYSLTRWDEAAMAQKAEEEVFNSLVRTFEPRVALMWSGFKVDKVLHVARESVQYDANQQRRLQPHLVEVNLTPSEKDFYKMLSLDVDKTQ